MDAEVLRIAWSEEEDSDAEVVEWFDFSTADWFEVPPDQVRVAVEFFRSRRTH